MQKILSLQNPVLSLQIGYNELAISHHSTILLLKVKSEKKPSLSQQENTEKNENNNNTMEIENDTKLEQKRLRQIYKTYKEGIDISMFKSIGKKYSFMVQVLNPNTYILLNHIKKRKVIKTIKIGDFGISAVQLTKFIFAFSGNKGFCIVNIMKNEIIYQQDDFQYCNNVIKIDENHIALIYKDENEGYKQTLYIFNWRNQYAVYSNQEKIGYPGSLFMVNQNTLAVGSGGTDVHLFSINKNMNKKSHLPVYEQPEIVVTKMEDVKDFDCIFYAKKFDDKHSIYCNMTGKLQIVDGNLKKVGAFQTGDFKAFNQFTVYNKGESVFLAQNNEIFEIKRSDFK